MFCSLAGRLGIFYGNKSPSSLQSFMTSIVLTEEQKSSMMVDLKEVTSVLEAGAQKQQLIDIECKNVFTQAPRFSISFKYVGILTVLLQSFGFANL